MRHKDLMASAFHECRKEVERVFVVVDEQHALGPVRCWTADWHRAGSRCHGSSLQDWKADREFCAAALAPLATETVPPCSSVNCFATTSPSPSPPPCSSDLGLDEQLENVPTKRRRRSLCRRLTLQSRRSRRPGVRNADMAARLSVASRVAQRFDTTCASRFSSA